MYAGLVIGLCLQVVGHVLHIIGVSTVEWSTVDSLNATGGLWEYCLNSACVDWSGNAANPLMPDIEQFFDNRLDVVRAISITALVLAPIAMLILIPAFFSSKEGIPFHFVAGGMAILTFVAIITSAIVWSEAIRDDIGIVLKLAFGIAFDIELGYSFALSVTGAVLILIGGIFNFLKNVDITNSEVEPIRQ